MATGRPCPPPGHRSQSPSQVDVPEGGPLAAHSFAWLLHHLGRRRRAKAAAEAAGVFRRPSEHEHGNVSKGADHAETKEGCGEASILIAPAYGKFPMHRTWGVSESRCRLHRSEERRVGK